MTTADLLAKHPEEWRGATQSRFLAAVGEGSLPDGSFRTWLVQDYLYVADLLGFQARLLALAPRAGQAVLAAGLVALEAELGWFEERARRLSLPLAGPAADATAAYARFLASCLADWAQGVTALWSGERAYLDAWAGVGAAPEPYAEFVAHWIQPEFVTYVEQLAELADAAGPDEPAFLGVCGLERAFWDMAWDSATT